MSAIRLVFSIGLMTPIIFMTSGCVTHSSAGRSTAPPLPAYQDREAITESLFTADQALLSNEDIHRILEGRITLPSPARMAILPFGQTRHRAHWQYSVYETVDEQSVDSILTQLIADNSVEHVSFLPSLMIPDSLSIAHLREAAARYQADMLLVYRVSTRSYSAYRWLRRDEAHTYVYVEAILLDIRTGIVPFASIYTEDVAVREDGEALTLQEARVLAEREAAGRALRAIVGDLLAFLDATP